MPFPKGLYYRIEIPDSLAGETLQVSITGDTVTGNNQLYLRKELIPSPSSYDFLANQPGEGNQDLIIPSLVEGTYYLYVTGVAPPAVSQEIQLSIAIIDFKLTNVFVNQGGNSGSVTVNISGAKFDNRTTFYLENETRRVYVRKISLQNSTSLFASFDLSGAELGVYDLVGVNAENDTSKLANGFEIVKGSFGASLTDSENLILSCEGINLGFSQELTINLDYPSSARLQQVFPIVIDFINTGNVDLPIPRFIFVSLDGAPIGLDPQKIDPNNFDLVVELSEKGNSLSVLRPGAIGTLTVYMKATRSDIDLSSPIPSDQQIVRFKLIE